MHGTLQQCAVFIEKPKIHSPCINTYTVKSAFLFCFYNSLFDLKEMPQRIPVHRVIQNNRIVGKSVHFFHPDLSVFQTSEDCPSASSAKVEREYLSFLIAHSRTSFHPAIAQGICISVAVFILTLFFKIYLCYNDKKYNNIHIFLKRDPQQNITLTDKESLCSILIIGKAVREGPPTFRSNITTFPRHTRNTSWHFTGMWNLN